MLIDVTTRGGDGHTQYGRALFELNIDGICANTPAAKGRVERAGAREWVFRVEWYSSLSSKW
jgi:hypothetical protein